MAEFDIVPFGDEWEESHARFAERNYPGKKRRADARYLRWKFRGPEKGDVPGLMVAVREGEVIGQTGLLPGIIHLGGEQQPLQWICEMMVEPELRRLGVTRALFDEAFGRGVITLGPDPSASARKALAAVGMSYSDSSWVMIQPLKLGPVVSTRYPPAAKADRLLTMAGGPALRVVNRKVRKASRSSQARACTWREVVDLVQAHEATMTASHAVHDEEFLAWRCGGFEGWVRELDAVQTEAGSYAIYERDTKRLTVHQWRADTDEEAATIFGRIHYVAGSYGLDFVQTYAADADEKARLERLAFQARRTRTDISVFPANVLDDGNGDFRFCGYDTDYQL